MNRFYSVSDFYKKKFGCKVYKISLDAGCTCPNRDGTKSFGGCIFCSGSGSGDFAADKNLSIAEQIIQAKQRVLSKNKDGKFIAYFQNFSNTYGNPSELSQKYNEAIAQEDVVGISIATRPDCLNDEILNEIAELVNKTFVSIELGFQTSKSESIEYIRRFFSNEEYLFAVKKIKDISEKIHVVTHLIFGLPNETVQDMLNSVKFVVDAKSDGIKIALLHVLEGTDLAIDYKNNAFSCLEMDEYFKILGKALKIIPKDVVIHRLTGDGPKKILIAPLWTGQKKVVYNAMNKYFDEINLIQGSD
ncbi:MAG: TIGR01212 family radical SAM protein [Treponema sp.]|nr:TIGR01212 family radical SAM protein [Treponema sp.]